MKNFKLRKDLSIEFNGRTLYRIEAINDFNGVKVGDIGGYVEKEGNLLDSAWVSGYAKVFDNVQVSGYAIISDNAQVSGYAKVSGYARVSECARVSGSAWVYGDAKVRGNTSVSGNADVSGYADVSENVNVFDNAKVRGNTSVSGNVQVSGDMKLSGNMRINKLNDVIHISGPGFPATITSTGINVGCKHYVDLEDFEKKYKQDGKDNGYSKTKLEYLHNSIKNALNCLKN